MSNLPNKVWIERDGDDHHLYLTDELAWTGYLTEYVLADNHAKLVEALREVTENLERARMMVSDSQVSSMLFDSTQNARQLLQDIEVDA
jgi:hypothetical protein